MVKPKPFMEPGVLGMLASHMEAGGDLVSGLQTIVTAMKESRNVTDNALHRLLKNLCWVGYGQYKQYGYWETVLDSLKRGLPFYGAVAEVFEVGGERIRMLERTESTPQFILALRTLSGIGAEGIAGWSKQNAIAELLEAVEAVDVDEMHIVKTEDKPSIDFYKDVLKIDLTELKLPEVYWREPFWPATVRQTRALLGVSGISTEGFKSPRFSWVADEVLVTVTMDEIPSLGDDRLELKMNRVCFDSISIQHDLDKLFYG